MITRCKGWKRNDGSPVHDEPRYKLGPCRWLPQNSLGTHWRDMVTEAYESNEITDGICPECNDIIRREKGLKPREENGND